MKTGGAFTLPRTQILRLCKQGRFLGAEKIGNVWIIPKVSVENYEPAPKGFAAVWERRRLKECVCSDPHSGSISE